MNHLLEILGEFFQDFGSATFLEKVSRKKNWVWLLQFQLAYIQFCLT